MADGEAWVYQYSGRAGNDLLNVRAESAEELFSRLDALFGEGTGKEAVAKFFTVAILSGSTTSTSTQTEPVSSAPAPQGTPDRPSEKQIKFAKVLGIKDAELLTRRELSAEIDKRKK